MEDVEKKLMEAYQNIYHGTITNEVALWTRIKGVSQN